MLNSIYCRFSILLLGLFFSLVPLPAQSQIPKMPPIGAPLVREGEYAIGLAYAFRLTLTDDETEAQIRLEEVGIFPLNGWIADYPVTPDIMTQLQRAISAAAISGRLKMDRADALKCMAAVDEVFGLSFISTGGKQYMYPADDPAFPDSAAINHYYTVSGPPIVSYYHPPPGYISLYAWVPSPFWYAGFRFSGFYILHEFHRPILARDRTVYISNRLWDKHHQRFYRIDPAKRLEIVHQRTGSRSDIFHVPDPDSLFREGHRGKDRGVIAELNKRMKHLRSSSGPNQTNPKSGVHEINRKQENKHGESSGKIEDTRPGDRNPNPAPQR
jgi:hypothetical protein